MAAVNYKKFIAWTRPRPSQWADGIAIGDPAVQVSMNMRPKNPRVAVTIRFDDDIEMDFPWCGQELVAPAASWSGYAR